jgi:glycosyltransferase involved in cell wall biosynthesis
LPDLSIVIPAFDWEREIARASGSCLAQEGADFEVIVVDDGSTARHTGVLASQAEWLIFLDSDDELAPGALKTIGAIAAQAAGDVHRLAFTYRGDDGHVSPRPPPREQIVDHSGFLAWLEGRQNSDVLACTRKLTFECVRYPETRWSDSALYQMDFAKRYRTWFREEILGFVHFDAGNRISLLGRFAPRTHQGFCRLRASYHFLAGNRAAGIRLALACLRATLLLPEAWALLILGAVNLRALATVRSWRRPFQSFIRRYHPARSELEA